MSNQEPLFDRPRVPEKPPRNRSSSRRVILIAGIILLVVITAVIAYSTRSCQTDLNLRANSPRNLAALMTNSFKNSDFAAFQALLTEEARIKINSDKFGEFQKLNTATALYGTYSLVRLENGRLLLVYATPPDESGLYKIQDIKLVPNEMNSLFNHVQ